MMSNINKMPTCGHALDVYIARDYLRVYPRHVAGLIAHSTVEQAELYDRTIIASVRKLVQSARIIYPKRLSAQ